MILTDKSTTPEIFQLFHPSQVERKYGGTSEDLILFWPPAPPSMNYGASHEEIPQFDRDIKNGNIIDEFLDMEIPRGLTFSDRVGSMADLKIIPRKYTQQQMIVESSFETLFPRKNSLLSDSKRESLSQKNDDGKENVEQEDILTSTSSMSISLVESFTVSNKPVTNHYETFVHLNPKTCEDDDPIKPDFDETSSSEIKQDFYVIKDNHKIFQWDFN